MPSDHDDLAEFRALVPKGPGPWIPLLIVAGAIGAIATGIVIYNRIPERGTTLTGEGYVVVLPSGQAWAMFAQGNSLPIKAESVARMYVQTGPCSEMEGGLGESGNEIDLEKLECKPGDPLLPAVVRRMQYLGAKFGYWDPSLKPAGDDMEPYLHKTPEVVAAMIDPRADDPQLIPLFPPLFTETLKQARGQGLAPPVLISVRRNDLIILRYRRDPLNDFLARDHFIFAGAADAGGWLVRELLVTPDGIPTLERLLVAPQEAPWPEKMHDTTLRVARRAGAREQQVRTGKQIDGGSHELP